MQDLTFIEFKSKGFWIPAGFIEVLSEYICQTFENVGISNFSQNIRSLYIACKLNRRGESMGMVDIPLDKVIDNDDKTTLLDILNQTKALILSKGLELSIETLDAFESRKTADIFKVVWGYPIATRSLNATIDIIIQMLNEAWDSDNYSVYYTGFPNPWNTTEI